MSIRLRPVLWTVQALMRRFRRAGGLLIIVAAAIVLIALLGLLDRLTGELTPVQGVALGLAVLIVIGRRVRRRTLRILPFANLVTEETKPRLDLVAAGLAEQLDLELRRIARLKVGSAFETVQDLYAERPERRLKPALQPSGGKLGSGNLRSTGPGAGTTDGGAPRDFGTLKVGPVSLQLSWLVGLASRWFAQVIAGKVFVSGQDVVVVVEHSGEGRWQSRCTLGGDDPTMYIPTLAREVAAQIAWHFARSERGGGDWRTLIEMVDGLDHFERYRRTWNVEALDHAEQSLTEAVTRSPLYAPAYYRLGAVYHARARLEGRPAKHAAVMWERAARLDPTSADAQLALAYEEMEDGRHRLAQQRCQQAIALRRSSRRPTSTARHVMADALFREALRFEVEPARACRAAVTQLRLAYDELATTRRIERLTGTPVQDLVEVDRELAVLASAEADVCEWMAWHNVRPRRARRRAERMRRRAVRARPEEAVHRARLADTLGARGRPELAFHQVSRALQLDPWAPVARQALAEAVANRPSELRIAAEIALSSLDVKPWDATEWLVAADLTASLGNPRCAIELAGAALALAPYDPTSHRLIARCLRAELSNEWAEAFETVADRLESIRGSLEGVATEADAHGHLRFVVDWTEAWMAGDPLRLPELAERGRPYSTLVANRIGSLHVSDPTEAVKWFAEAIKWFAESEASKLAGFRQPPVDWFLDLADGYANLGESRKAAEAYEEVVDRDAAPMLIRWANATIELLPEASEPTVRARALAGRAAVALREGDLERAWRDCAEALRLEPGNASAYATEAEIFGRRGQHEEAVARWRLVAQSDPSDARRADAGIADERRNQAFEERDDARRAALFAGAIAAYRRALQADEPLVRIPFARAYLGRCLAEVGKMEQAMPQLEEAAKTAGGDAQYVAVHHELGHAYEKAGRLAQAEDSYREAENIALRALQEASERAAEERVGPLREASYTCNLLAWFLVKHEIRLEEAEHAATQAVQLAEEAFNIDPSATNREAVANFRDTLGWVRHRRGRQAAAIEDLNAAVQLSPQPLLRYHLALALEARADGHDDPQRHVSDKTAARQQWLLIRELHPESQFSAIAADHLRDAAERSLVPEVVATD